MLIFKGGDGGGVGEEQLPSKTRICSSVLRVEMVAASKWWQTRANEWRGGMHRNGGKRARMSGGGVTPPPCVATEANEWRGELAACHGYSQYIYQKRTCGRTFCTCPVVFIVVPGGY